MTGAYCITTFGCQMNDYDSSVMAGVLEAKGFSPTDDEARADVVIYNTCVVREHAERRARSRIDQLRALKRRRPEVVLGVTGCMAQKDAQALARECPHLDLILGSRAVSRLGDLLDRARTTGQTQICVDVLDEAYPADVRPIRPHPLKGLVGIILGCNNACSYCIVPRVRGREASRASQTILDEVRALADDGCREITLVGQNVNAYRAEGMDFADLLRAVSQAAPGAWIRYITSHPRDCDERHLAAVAECANVCEHFHLPAQSGANAVLKRMRRAYTREQFLELIDRIRARLPQATFTTDLIVGFPGESDADYERTLDLVRRARFDSAFMYLYSPRPGTPAAERFDDAVALDVKKERLTRLIELQEGLSREINESLVDAEREVLIERTAPRTEGDLLARTRGDKMVVLPGPPEWIGRFVRVRIRRANSHTLFAECLDDAPALRHGGGSRTDG